MVVFEATEICSVEDGSYRTRSWGVRAPELAASGTLYQAAGALMVEGLHRDDFMLRAGLIDDNVAADVSYLVISHNRGSGTIVPTRMAMENPQDYLSQDLARKLQSLSSDVVADLGLTPVIEYLNRR